MKVVPCCRVHGTLYIEKLSNKESEAIVTVCIFKNDVLLWRTLPLLCRISKRQKQHLRSHKQCFGRSVRKAVQHSETYVHTYPVLFTRRLSLLWKKNPSIPICFTAVPQMHIWKNVLKVGVILKHIHTVLMVVCRVSYKRGQGPPSCVFAVPPPPPILGAQR